MALTGSRSLPNRETNTATTPCIRRLTALPGSKVDTKIGLRGVVRKVRGEDQGMRGEREFQIGKSKEQERRGCERGKRTMGMERKGDARET